MKNLEKYTNVPDRYEVARLIDTNCILVHTFHQRDYGHGFNHHWNIDEIQSKMDWQNAPYIFIFGQEANCKYWVNQDSRIHVWDNSVECMPRHHTFMWWWEQVRQVEADQQALHRLNSPLESTPKYIFDFLVQVRYKHRNFVLEQIEKCKLQDKILLPADTYVTGCPDVSPCLATLFYETRGSRRGTRVVCKSLCRFISRKRVGYFMGWDICHRDRKHDDSRNDSPFVRP